MRTTIGLSIFLAACTAAPERQLPTATFTPHLDSQETPVACGEDVAFYGNPAPDLRYLFTYDTAGRITHAAGTWANNGPTDTIDYTWAGDNLTHLIGVSGWDGSQHEVTASYNPAGSLLDYTWSYTDGTYTDEWTYVYSSFIGVYQPTQLTITSPNFPTVWSYQLGYDASNRLVSATPNSGPSTTWTYDDMAGTITSNTGNGAFHDVLTYDADYRLLSATWGGTDPSAIDGEQTYAWTGNQLNTVTYRSGTQQAPHQLQLVQVDTLRYDCSAARSGQTTRRINARSRR